MKTNYRFGINMKKYLSEHDRYLEEQINNGVELEKILVYHAMKITWLQHERLIHLIVTALTVLAFLFSFALLIFSPLNVMNISLILIITGLMVAYLIHYFILENKVQYWYKIYDELYQKMNQKSFLITVKEEQC